MSDLDELELAARRFVDAASQALGQKHPLPRLFSGLMMIFWVDEPTLKWVDLAMALWFADAEEISERQEAEIVRAYLWLSVATQAKRSLSLFPA